MLVLSWLQWHLGLQCGESYFNHAIWCVNIMCNPCSVFMKVRQSTDIASCKTDNVVSVTENSAYELTRYQTRETVVSTEEHVYAVPT